MTDVFVSDLTDDVPEEGDPNRLRSAPQKYAGLRMFMRNKAAVFGAVLLMIILFITFVLPLFITGDRTARVGNGAQTNKMPCLVESIDALCGDDGLVTRFGTDYNGRDNGLIVMRGGSATLKVAGLAALVIVGLGTTVGAIAGYYGGWVDSLLMRITEFFQVLPSLLFAIAIVALYGTSTKVIVIAIGVTAWPTIARLVRAEFFRQKNLEYVKAAKAIGASNFRIITRTIFPNTMPVVIVQSTLVMGAAILTEAGLAFLGLSKPSDLSWGFFMGQSRRDFFSNHWGVTLPGILIFCTVLSLSLIGDGLQDAMNPKLRGR